MWKTTWELTLGWLKHKLCQAGVQAGGEPLTWALWKFTGKGLGIHITPWESIVTGKSEDYPFTVTLEQHNSKGSTSQHPNYLLLVLCSLLGRPTVLSQRQSEMVSLWEPPKAPLPLPAYSYLGDQAEPRWILAAKRDGQMMHRSPSSKSLFTDQVRKLRPRSVGWGGVSDRGCCGLLNMFTLNIWHTIRKPNKKRGTETQRCTQNWRGQERRREERLYPCQRCTWLCDSVSQRCHIH